jgi:acyl-CoA dehydrogenase
MGFTRDTPIANIWLTARYLRMADGPDEAHMSQLGKLKIAEYNAQPLR